MLDFDSEITLGSLLAYTLLLLVIGVLLSVYGVPNWLLPEDDGQKK